MPSGIWERFNSFVGDPKRVLKVKLTGETVYGYLTEVGEDYFVIQEVCRDKDKTLKVKRERTIRHNGEAPDFSVVSEDEVPSCNPFRVAFF